MAGRRPRSAAPGPSSSSASPSPRRVRRTPAGRKANAVEAVVSEIGSHIRPAISSFLDRYLAGEAEASSLGSDKKERCLQTAVAEYGDGVRPALSQCIDQFVAGEASALRDPPPSSFALRNTWKQYQFSQQPPRFLAYRGPLAAKPRIPLVLLHKSFSKFALDLESDNTMLSEEDYQVAEDVYEMFTLGFDNELQQMNGGKQLSNRFDAYLGTGSFTQFKDIKMDALMAYTHNHHLFIVFEDKTDDGPNGYFEGLEICRRLFSEQPFLSHGILVLRACPYMVVIALVMDREQNALLSEPLAHVPFWGPEYQTVLQGARAMRALRSFAENYEIKSAINTSIPFPIAAWQDVRPLNKSGLVFRGTLQGRFVVAKFTQHYSRAAHEAWHEKNLAPQLYGVEDLGAGWKLVTMDYLSEHAGWHSVAEVPPDDTLRHLLTDILKEGHETGYVHGDFRPCNLLINEHKAIQVIDFEWAGYEDVARYPVKLNPKVSWEPTARRGAVLKKDHDLWLVNNFAPGAA